MPQHHVVRDGVSKLLHGRPCRSRWPHPAVGHLEAMGGLVGSPSRYHLGAVGDPQGPLDVAGPRTTRARSGCRWRARWRRPHRRRHDTTSTGPKTSPCTISASWRAGHQGRRVVGAPAPTAPLPRASAAPRPPGHVRRSRAPGRGARRRRAGHVGAGSPAGRPGAPGQPVGQRGDHSSSRCARRTPASRLCSPGRSCTSPPRVSALRDALEVGVGEHHRRRLASELEVHPLRRRRRAPHTARPARGSP